MGPSQVANDSSKPLSRYLGSIRPELSLFKMYLVEDGRVLETWHGGASLAAEERVENMRLNFFQVTIPAGQTQSITFSFSPEIRLTLVLQSLSQSKFTFQHQLADVTHFSI